MLNIPRIAIRAAISLVVLGVVFIIAVRSADTAMAALMTDIPWQIYLAIGVCLLTNAVAGALRFKYLAARLGGAIRLADAVAIVSASNIAGALFFQLAGQLATRGALMSRLGGGAFANAVVITAYERLSAALVSAIGAALGAYMVFGHIYLDMSGGAAMLVKLTVGGTIALITGLVVSGVGPSIVSAVDGRALYLWTIAAVLSLLVQIPMVLAYMLAAHSLAPSVSLISLLGATLVVMFAASIPISFAGWGVRELSAVVALGAIGVSSGQAFLAAVIIGLGSMAAAGICAAATLPAILTEKAGAKAKLSIPPERVDYGKMLALMVPMLVAIAVPFQIHVPIARSLVNVNMADPLALVGAALFMLRMRDGHVPPWRYSFVHFYAAAATLIFAIAVVLGIVRFGVTDWALLNRLCGWLLVLAYAATGALVVSEHGIAGALKAIGAFIGAMIAVCAVEFVLLVATTFVALDKPIISKYAAEGFAQNRNAFAFQILIALCAAIAFHRRFGTAAAAALLAGLCLTWSRSGLLTGLVVIGFAAVALFDLRRILMIAGVLVVLPVVTYLLTVRTAVMQRIFSTSANMSERMETVTGAVRLFFDHPLLGAGIGAYRYEGHLSYAGEPLVIHSSWLWLLAETGLVGLLILVVPPLYIIRREVETFRTDPISAAIVLSLVVMGLMGIPADMFFQRTFWLMAGLLLAFSRGAAVQQLPQPERARS
jgi:hypothetical protein